MRDGRIRVQTDIGDQVTALQFGVGGSLATSTASGRVDLFWLIPQPQEASLVIPLASYDTVDSATRQFDIDPTGRYFVVANRDRGWSLFSVNAQRASLMTASDQGGRLPRFLPGGLLASLQDNRLVVEELTGNDGSRLLNPRDRLFYAVLSEDGEMAVGQSWDRVLVFPSAPAMPRTLNLNIFDETLLALYADVKYLVTSSRAKWNVWEIENLEAPLLEIAPGGAPQAGTLNGSSHQLAAAFQNPDRLIVWNLRSGESVKLETPESGEAQSLRFSPDGKLLLLRSKAQSFRVYRTDDGTVALSSPPGEGFRQPVFNRDGNLVMAIEVSGNRVRIWSLQQGQERVLEGHSDAILHAAFSPSGSDIVTSSADGTARIWDERGMLKRVLSSDEQPVKLARFSQDGRHVLTVTDANVRIWSGANVEAVIQSSVIDAVFTPNGQLFTVDGANRLRVTPLAIDQVISEACSRLSRTTLREGAWSRYLPGEELRPTCPSQSGS